MPNTARELPPATYSAPDRDPVIVRDGCRIYLHIHDAEYMRQRAEWRQRLAAAHPDRGGTAKEFRRLIVLRQQWQQREGVWYARLGLTPPDGWGATTPGIHQNIRERAIATLNRPSVPQLSDRRTGRIAPKPSTTGRK